MDTTTSNQTVGLIFMLLFYLLPIVLLIFFGCIGMVTERRHYQSIREREQTHRNLPIVPIPSWDPDQAVAESRLVAASVVISLDHFKRFFARLRNIFGGRVRAYESLLDRARREALLRLKEQCPDADLIANMRMETSAIANTRGKQGAGGVEVLAFGTMIKYAKVAPPPLSES